MGKGNVASLHNAPCFMLIDYTECGISRVEDCEAKTVHITGGSQTTNSMFPWVVNIHHNKDWQEKTKQDYIRVRMSMYGPILSHCSHIELNEIRTITSV